VFRADGKPYRLAEVDLIRRLASEPTVLAPAASDLRSAGRR
jgi:hypothetical protein